MNEQDYSIDKLPIRITFWNKKVIVLKDIKPTEEQSISFLCKFLECCKEDYVKLYKFDTDYEEGGKYSDEEIAYISAKLFLFDDTYKIQFGDWHIGFVDMINIISCGDNIDIEKYRDAIQGLQDTFILKKK